MKEVLGVREAGLESEIGEHEREYDSLAINGINANPSFYVLL